MKAENIRLIILWIVYFLYMVIGALMFSELEYENEIKQRQYFLALMARIRQDYNLSSEVMNTLSQAHGDACSQGVRLQKLPSSKWDFVGSFYFAGTVITTIGFGFSSPGTTGGQICFIPYALLGIPLNILLFNTLLERAVLIISSLLGWGRKVFSKRSQKPDHKSNSDGGDQYNVETSSFYIGLVCFNALVVIVLLASVLFMYMEDWNYFESVYFCVVTLTTVGFGDYVPSSSRPQHGKNHSSGYRLGNWLLIVVGLVFMYPSLAIAASLYKELISYVTNATRRHFPCICGAHAREVVPLSIIEQNQLGRERNKNSGMEGDDGELRSINGSVASLRSTYRGSRGSIVHVGSVAAVEQSIMRSRVDLGVVAAVEASLMRSRASLKEHVQYDSKSELDKVQLAETRLTKEYVEAIEQLQQRKQTLLEEIKLANSAKRNNTNDESGVLLKVNSTYSDAYDSSLNTILTELDMAANSTGDSDMLSKVASDNDNVNNSPQTSISSNQIYHNPQFNLTSDANR